MGYSKKAEFVTGKGRDAKVVDGAAVTLTTAGWEAVNEKAAEQYFNAVQSTDPVVGKGRMVSIPLATSNSDKTIA